MHLREDSKTLARKEKERTKGIPAETIVPILHRPDLICPLSLSLPRSRFSRLSFATAHFLGFSGHCLHFILSYSLSLHLVSVLDLHLPQNLCLCLVLVLVLVLASHSSAISCDRNCPATLHPPTLSSIDIITTPHTASLHDRRPKSMLQQ